MSRSSSSSGIVLFATSAAVLAGAFLLWQTRSNLPASATTTPQPNTHVEQFRSEPRALDLLRRTYETDNTLRYSAISTTTAMYGAHKMESKARLMRAPRRLTIAYL